jgi:hypothetical protein
MYEYVIQDLIFLCLIQVILYSFSPEKLTVDSGSSFAKFFLVELFNKTLKQFINIQIIQLYLFTLLVPFCI